jgi:hypothetical protein
MSDIRPAREPAERSWKMSVCPTCSRAHDGLRCAGGFDTPHKSVRMDVIEVVPLAEVERLRLRVDELELHVPCAECIQEREDAEAEVERLREALEDAVDYLRLGSVWIDDADRHDKLKRACERARCSLAALGPAGTTGATNPSA